MRYLNYKLLISFLICLFLFQLQYVKLSYSQEPGPGGSELFKLKRCERCHTIGRGKFVGPDLLTIDEKYSREELLTWITDPGVMYKKTGKMPINEGYPPMPPQNVNRQEAEKLADYIISFEEAGDSIDRGKIAGRVFNFSENNKPVSGVNVVLKSYLGDRKTDERAKVSDTSGEFIFSELGWNRSYEISLLYREANYTTDKMVFSPGESLIELDLPVYEPTNSYEKISLQQHHIVVDIKEKSINIGEVIDIENGGKKIYTGSRNESLNLEKQTMVIDLAPNAENLNLVQGLNRNNLILKDNKIYDTSAIPPGYKRITFTYDIQPGTNSIEINKNTYFRTENMLLLVNENGFEVKVKGLTRGNDVEFGQQSYSRWQGSGIEMGSNITLTLERSLLGRINNYKLIPLVLFLIFITTALIYNFIYKKQNTG